jgi:hypothetical protein
MKHAPTIAAIALVVSGCGGAGSGKAQTVGGTGAATPQPPAAATLPAPVSNEQCDAPSLSYLIGHPHTDIPVPVDPSHRRVYCTGCVITQDYRPDRTDIVYDARTGLITVVKCG